MQDRDRQGGQTESKDDGQIGKGCHLAVSLGQILLGHELRHDAALDRPEEGTLRSEQKEDGKHGKGPSRVERREGQQQQDQFSPFHDHDQIALAVTVR